MHKGKVHILICGFQIEMNIFRESEPAHFETRRHSVHWKSPANVQLLWQTTRSEFV